MNKKNGNDCGNEKLTTIAMYISLPLFFLKINSNMLGEFSIIFSLLAKMTTPKFGNLSNINSASTLYFFNIY